MMRADKTGLVKLRGAQAKRPMLTLTQIVLMTMQEWPVKQEVKTNEQVSEAGTI